jgi:hypothetical protein
MSDMGVAPVAESAPQGLSQWQRVTNTFTAPSKTFEDIKRGNKSWWLPLIITVLGFVVFFASVQTRITWAQVYENQMRDMPQFAKDMMDRMTPEQKAEAARRGPTQQAINAAVTPLFIILINLLGAGILMGTINFGFGGKAKYSSLLAVEFYAGLAIWAPRWILAAITTPFVDPEAFNIQNPSPCNIAAFFPSLRESSLLAYALLSSIDALTIWGMVLTGIGVAAVAGVKRSSGYIAVFGWWFVGVLIFVGIAAIFG